MCLYYNTPYMPKTENRICDAENDELMRVITRLNLSHSSHPRSTLFHLLPRESIKIPRSIQNDHLTPSALSTVAATLNRCTRPLSLKNWAMFALTALLPSCRLRLNVGSQTLPILSPNVMGRVLTEVPTRVADPFKFQSMGHATN
jgi:hypothetical protein